MEEYSRKAKTKTIKYSSRASINIKDAWYTFEYGEERTLPNSGNVSIDEEIRMLTQDCDAVVDRQIAEVIDSIVRKN